MKSEYAREFFYQGNKTGILLIHGFTGTPSELRYLGDFLREKGYTVNAVLLKGHGTTPEDMGKTNHRDWISSARAAFKDLKEKCDEVFMVGLSMGGVLSLYLANELEPQGLVSISTPIRLCNRYIGLSHLLRYVKPYKNKKLKLNRDPLIISYNKVPLSGVCSLLKLMKQVEASLHSIDKPILIIQSYKDATVRPESANIIYNKIGSKDKSIIYLYNSEHVATCDCEKEQIFEEIHNFIKNRAKCGEDTRSISELCEMEDNNGYEIKNIGVYEGGRI